MLFNSTRFMFVFMPVVLIGHSVLGRLPWRLPAVIWLAVASLAFYAWDEPQRLLPLILVSIAFNFLLGRALARRPSRVLLAIGLCGDLLLLGYFKYVGFLSDTLAAVTGLPLPNPRVALPIGISFFTFTQIAFLVDAYRREATEYPFWRYMLFVSFFPHLVAGPILHHKEIMPQLDRADTYRFDVRNFNLGLTWFALGLAKKVVLADSLAAYASPVFAAAAAGKTAGFTDAWLAVMSYTLQLYYDFSGYSDMAIGLARMVGIRFPLNFDSPYKAASLIDFWRRWHMTLSRFLREYLYFPLGGNRKGRLRRYVNLMITMLLGGLWHGAGWNFVVWGGLHGLGLVVNHAWQRFAHPRGRALPKAAAIALTLLFVVLAWVPFRAENLTASVSLWASMAGLNGWWPAKSVLAGQMIAGVLWVTTTLLWALFAPNTQQVLANRGGIEDESGASLAWRPNPGWAAAAGIVFGVALSRILGNGPSEFLYFKF